MTPAERTAAEISNALGRQKYEDKVEKIMKLYHPLEYRTTPGGLATILYSVGIKHSCCQRFVNDPEEDYLESKDTEFWLRRYFRHSLIGCPIEYSVVDALRYIGFTEDGIERFTAHFDERYFPDQPPLYWLNKFVPHIFLGPLVQSWITLKLKGPKLDQWQPVIVRDVPDGFNFVARLFKYETILNISDLNIGDILNQVKDPAVNQVKLPGNNGSNGSIFYYPTNHEMAYYAAMYGHRLGSDPYQDFCDMNGVNFFESWNDAKELAMRHPNGAILVYNVDILACKMTKKGGHLDLSRDTEIEDWRNTVRWFRYQRLNYRPWNTKVHGKHVEKYGSIYGPVCENAADRHDTDWIPRPDRSKKNQFCVRDHFLEYDFNKGILAALFWDKPPPRDLYDEEE